MSILLRKMRAFTLVELMVVVGIIAILAALIFPALQNALIKAKVVKVLNNGRSVSMIVMAKSMENQATGIASLYPAGQFANSTLYFKDLLDPTKTFLEGFDFSFFWASGLPVISGVGGSSNAVNFNAPNNAWCVTDNLNDNSPGNTPFMFVKNVGRAGGIVIVAGNKLNQLACLTTNNPFGTRYTAIVSRDCSARVIKGDDFDQTNFNNSAQVNVVLVP